MKVPKRPSRLNSQNEIHGENSDKKAFSSLYWSEVQMGRSCSANGLTHILEYNVLRQGAF